MSNPNLLDQPSETARKRAYPSIRHNLHEINLERQTAFCTVCGYTEIHITKSRTRGQAKVYCVSRFQELSQENQKRQREERRSRPGWKPRHSLSQIDTEKKTATCSVCGPTDIWKDTNKDSHGYICAKKARVYGRKYHRNYYASRRSNPHLHILSQIDEEEKTAVCSICGPVSIYMWQTERKIGRRCSNASVQGVPPAQKIRREVNTNLINHYKVEHGCRRCGYNANLNFLDLSSRSPDKKVPKIEKLLKLTHTDLTEMLENCEVLCIYCRSLASVELVWKSQLSSVLSKIRK